MWGHVKAPTELPRDFCGDLTNEPISTIDLAIIIILINYFSILIITSIYLLLSYLRIILTNVAIVHTQTPKLDIYS